MLIQTQILYHIYSSGSDAWTSDIRCRQSCQCRPCPRSVFYVRNVFCGPSSATTSASSSCFTEMDGSCQKFVLVESFCRRLDGAARVRAEWKGKSRKDRGAAVRTWRGHQTMTRAWGAALTPLARTRGGSRKFCLSINLESRILPARNLCSTRVRQIDESGSNWHSFDISKEGF